MKPVLSLTPEAAATCAAMSPVQIWFFVCSSRAADALVVMADIDKEKAQREARKINGVARVGRVVDGKAVCL